ncbi:hypothetical protein BEL05_03635 [Shewanella colwelliana]|uniref:DUF423 domain-containing protein n=1 Tax=Shewanella colwelliana TaxID=23 RepID=A0A1E5INQ4_SHECO|nr:hypothetical protein [Shewanella colwelliana]OEG72097.1 hypothetical protein BEL05_03635 [Shewanella colwelliana]
MNIYFVIAATFALLTCVGHFTIGIKSFLTPMLDANFDPIAQKIMQCVFHYVSVFLVMSTLVLYACGLEMVSIMQGYGLVLFIALNYLLFAVWQIYIGFFSDIESPFKSLFQWFFFAAISFFTLLGVFQSL